METLLRGVFRRQVRRQQGYVVMTVQLVHAD